MRFLTPTHIDIVFTLFNQKNTAKNRYTRKQPTQFSMKQVYKETTYTFFYDTLKSEF